MKTKQYHLSKSGELEIEFIAGEQLEAYDELAREILDECRTSITMAARFLNAALWRLPIQREPLYHTISVGARFMQYDPERVVERYRENPNELVRDCLHAVLHCVFHHPFDQRFKEADTWSLACDITVELCAIELGGTRFPSLQDDERLKAARRLRQIARNLTAPALYQVLHHGGPGEQLYLAQGLTGRDLAELRNLFVRDAHGLWANGADDPSDAAGGHAAIPDLQAGGKGEVGEVGASEASSSSDVSEASSVGGAETGGNSDNADNNPGNFDNTDSADGTDEAESAVGGQPATDDDDGDDDDDDVVVDPVDDEALEEWRRVSKQVEAELRMQRRGATGNTGNSSLFQNLKVATRKPADYDGFLSRFATFAEDIRINDDEFDYVFYTYGLNRYGNMPLVEPLEYVESNRVREFVIALDTSGSCSGDLIRTFVQRTYDVLRQRTSFGDEINVHIVQCDKEIRSATKITSLRQLEEFRDSFWVSGGGGTDFKPVFSYVDSLVEQGEFNDLRGLIYFTDGYGSFPVRPPDYEVAFVFVDTEALDVRVPPWAMKVIMTQDEIMQDEGRILTKGRP